MRQGPSCEQPLGLDIVFQGAFLHHAGHRPGAIVGGVIARGAVILLVATVLITLTPLAELQAWQQASLRPTFIELRDWAVSQLDQWERELPTPPESLRDISLPELRRPQPTLPSSSAPEVE